MANTGIWIGAAVGGGLLLGATMTAAAQTRREATALALQQRIAASVGIPYSMRQWAAPVASAAVVTAPDELGAERWAIIGLAQIARESGGVAGIHGDGGHAHGLMQINDRFHPKFVATGEAAMHDPAANILYGQKFLASLYDTFKGLGALALPAALAAYNAGVGGVRKALAAGKHPDAATTGGDYSTWILKHADDYFSALPIA